MSSGEQTVSCDRIEIPSSSGHASTLYCQAVMSESRDL